MNSVLLSFVHSEMLPDVIWSSVGALAGVKNSDAVVEAVMQGDVDTAKRLLRVAESGKQLLCLGDFGRHGMCN